MKQYWNKQKLDLVNERHGQVRRGHLTTVITRTEVKWTAVSICDVTDYFFFAVFSGHKFVAMREVREAAVVDFSVFFLHSFCLLIVNDVQKSLLVFFCFGKFFWLRQLDDFGHHHGGIKKFSHVSPLQFWTFHHFFCFVKGRTENAQPKLWAQTRTICVKHKAKRSHL